MSEFYLRNKKQLDKLATILIFALAAYVFFVYIFKYIAPFFFGYLLSLIVEPIVNALHKKLKISRGFGAVFCILIAILLIFGLGASLVSKLWHELQNFTLMLPDYINHVSVTIESLLLTLADHLKLLAIDVDDTFLNQSFSAIGANLVTSVSNLVGTGVKGGSLGLVSSIPFVFMNIFLFLFSAFFFIKDRTYIYDIVTRHTPPIIVDHFRLLRKGLFAALGGYLKAQAIIMSIVAIISIAALMIIQYPYALLIGIIIAFVDALPLFGSGFLLWPWAAFSLISGNYKQAVALMILYGINMLVRQLLEPKVLSAQIGLYPLVTLMSIYIGLQIFGGMGFLIGPIVVISIKILITNNPQ